MLVMNIKYNSHNSVLLPLWGNVFKMLLVSVEALLSGVNHYFLDLIGGQKLNITFGGGGGVTFGIIQYMYII